MQYLGTGFSVINEIINPKDELKLFQQICGGENICVYKGYLSPGESFQFISKRHYGFPFSASLYINGLIAARISSCCEYRYHVGFQQGRRGCFRIAELSGGTPCYRCIESHTQKQFRIKEENHHITGSTCEESSNSKENIFSDSELMLWPEETHFLSQTHTENRKKNKATTGSNTESIRWKKGHGLPNVQDNQQALQVSADRHRRRLRKKKVKKEESDSELENDLIRKDQSFRKWKANHSETRAHSVQNKLAEVFAGGNSLYSEVELSDSSDSSVNPGTAEIKWKTEEATKTDTDQLQMYLAAANRQEEAQDVKGEENMAQQTLYDIGVENSGDDDIEEALVNQVTDLITVLHESDEVDQLVLRNTGLTDVLLQHLTTAITESKSEVEKINLNLNDLGPVGMQSIIQLLEVKPCLKSLLLYGNQFGDDGIIALMSGLSKLQTTNWYLERGPSSAQPRIQHELLELDVGGNQLTTEGLQSVASFLRLNPPLKYLGLAQCTNESWEAWTDLFGALKVNTNINHLLLDDNNLGDPGAKLLAEAITINQSLITIDLDSNNIGDKGVQAISESIKSNAGSILKSLSLEENPIGKDVLDRIHGMLRLNENK
ncbi:uncharacterized protein O3C94_011607 [Discoglossus pictus]